MKILRVISSMQPSKGGPCQGIRNSIPMLKKLGIENEVLCFDSQHIEYGKEDPFKVYKIGPTITSYAYTKKLSKWLYEHIHNYDLIIIHGLWQYHNYGTFKVWNKLKNKNKKVPQLFIMPHGMLDPYFQRTKTRLFKSIRNYIFWEIIEKHTINNVNGLLFTCENELKLARQTFSDYKPKKEINIDYGVESSQNIQEIDTNLFLKKYNISKNESYYLYLSRIDEKKGIDLLLKSYKKLKKYNIDLPKLVVAGPLNTDYSNNLKRIYSDEDIIFTNILLGKEKWAALKNCEYFILPSHQENFGISIVEAMALGIPVAISNKVNIYDKILEYDAGIVFNDDLRNTYKALKKISMLSLEEKQIQSNNALNLYHNNYTPKIAAKKFITSLNLN